MRKKRIISLFLSFVLAISLLFTVNLDAKAISRNDVVSQLNSYISQYNGRTATSAQMYTGEKQCKGFADWLFLNIFGVYIGPYPASANYKITNPNAQTVGILEPGNLNAATAKELLQKGVPGDYIQVQRSTARGRGPHSMILTGVNDNGIEVFDCNSDGKNTIKTYSISWSSFDTANRAMSLYHAYNYDSTSSAPSNPQICFNKQVYGLENNLDIKLSADEVIDYYIVQIWNGNQLVCSKETTNDYISIPCNQLGAGTYGAYVSAFNTYGYCTSSTVTFRIAEKLSNPHIYLNKEKFLITDTLEFVATADGGADYYGLQIWKGSEAVYGKTFTGHTLNVSCSELGIGDYGAFISCVNESGSNVI